MATLQAVHISAYAWACPQQDPTGLLKEGRQPEWSSVEVPGHPGTSRPYGFLNGREQPEAALDRLISDVLASAGLSDNTRRNMPVVLGTSSLNVGQQEQRLAEDLKNHDQPPVLEDARWGHMLEIHCRRHGLKGPQSTINTACSSSANGLLHAQRLLSLGLADAVLVLGFEAYNGISFGGFHGLMLLSPNEYRPFDAHREGIILAEGVAAAVVTRSDRRSQACLHAAFSNIDCSSVTVASEDSLVTVMEEALALSGQDRVDAIKAHGTGTAGNDHAEASAIQRVFGQQSPPYFSLKGALGHSLGACGLTELLSLMDCRQAGFMPASLGYLSNAVDDPATALAMEPAVRSMPWNDTQTLLLNYFGFGGNNTSMVVSL